jgi:hypothetical protein
MAGCLIVSAPTWASPSYTATTYVVSDVSADGSTVVGYPGNRQPPGSTLIVNGVPVDIATGGLNVLAYGAADDGSLAGGTIEGGSITIGSAMYWTAATGWTPLGAPDGTPGPCDTTLNSVSAVSGSGQYIIGQTSTSLGVCRTRAYRWDQVNGFQVLMGSVPTYTTTAWGVSDDGTIVAGVDHAGSSNQQACYWDISGTQYLIPAAVPSRAWGVSHNGQYIVGESTIDGAWVYSVVTGAYQPIGQLISWARSGAGFAVSDDGNTVVGAHNEGFSIYADGFIWINGTGLRDLGTYLVEQGVPVGRWDPFNTAHHMSADATVFGGTVGTALGATGGFVATLY